MKSLFFVLCSSVLGRLQDSLSKVLVCRGAFSVRQSVCSGSVSDADVVPNETFACTGLTEPAAAADMFGDGSSINFSSVITIRDSLAQLPTALDVEVFFSGCEAPTNLPRLDERTEYLALIVVDQATMDSSRAMTAGSVSMHTPIKYVELDALTDASFRKLLESKFDACHDGPCQIPFSTSIVSKPGYVAFV